VNKNLLLVIIGIVLVLGAFVGVFFLGKASKVCDTVSVAPITIHDTTEGKIKFKIIHVQKELTSNQIDSIANSVMEALRTIVPKDTVYKERPQTYGLFVASKDTTYQDSLLQSHSEIRSRIPIDPKLKWLQDFTIKKTTITKEVDRPKGFFDRFGYGIEVGIGYGVFNKVFDTWIGFGFHYEF
jgi:hypothetical protein